MTLEQLIVRDMPDWAAKMDAAKAAGTFTTLADFYEKNRPAAEDDKPNTLGEALGVIAVLQGSIEQRARELAAVAPPADLAALRTRAESAESQLAAAQGRIGELESAERASVLGEQLATLTRERNQALSAKALGERNLALMEGLCGVQGIDPADAIPASSASHVGTSTAAEFEARFVRCKTDEEKTAVLTDFAEAVKKGAVKH